MFGQHGPSHVHVHREMQVVMTKRQMTLTCLIGDAVSSSLRLISYWFFSHVVMLDDYWSGVNRKTAFSASQIAFQSSARPGSPMLIS